LAKSVEKKISEVEGIYGATDSISEPFPETKIIINKSRASFYKLSVLNIAQAANIAVKGAVASSSKKRAEKSIFACNSRKRTETTFGNCASLRCIHRWIWKCPWRTLFNLKKAGPQ